ncbi:MAG: DUF4133 domain-containing protein [Nibricoccus sp.]
MNSIHLNEHDANQGAQSSGEFLGMTGNSGWYLLGSGGATIMMVIFLWGILGVSLLLCLFIGIILCLGSLAYVFALKNNKPAHYDTDFFESVLVESGMLEFRFGPRHRRLTNPFTNTAHAVSAAGAEKIPRRARAVSPSRTARRERAATEKKSGPGVTEINSPTEHSETVVPRETYKKLQEKLSSTEELLEEALAEAAED